MRSSEESHSHPFENEEFRQLCETKRKKRRIVIAKNDNAESFCGENGVCIGKRTVHLFCQREQVEKQNQIKGNCWLPEML